MPFEPADILHDPTAEDRIARTARSVLSAEAAALLEMAETLPKDLEPAVRTLLNRDGMVVVAGVGKSGHIGRKIAATLASTGTPSFFIHPTEASHGDLGMIRGNDTCLLISNSGETTELKDLLHHCKRFSIPVIAITARPDSTLAMSADYNLFYPATPEACPLGLAPMTSTTLTLALGDALAASLMEERGFRQSDFSVLHPGGKLGAQLTRVSQLMHRGDYMPLVEFDVPMKDTVLVMSKKGFGTAGVVNGGKLIGVITDGDLRRRIDNLFEHTAGEIMTPDPVTIAQDEFAATALALLEERAVSALFVISEEREPVGILHMHDLLRGGVA